MTAGKQQDLELCDLVMKGGATSGVIYPPVIAELAHKYRFENIGGTSAGAIAATMTAAGEYGRQRGHLKDFSGEMNRLSTEISRPGMLLTLFRSSAPPHLRPVLDTLLPLVSDPQAEDKNAAPSGPSIDQQALGAARLIAPELIDILLPPEPPGTVRDQGFTQTLQGRLAALPTTHSEAYEAGAYAGAQAGVRLGQYLIGAAVVLSVLFGLPLLAGTTTLGWVIWVVLALLLIGGAFVLAQRLGRASLNIGGTLTALTDLGRLVLQEVPRNLYGICTGRRQEPDPGSEEQPALTDWLNEWINTMAGPTEHGGPLTFADLADQGVTLQMVTTNLSHGRPYELPFSSDFVLLFRRGDMEHLFPPEVVRYMADARHVYPGWSLDELNAGKSPDDPDSFWMLPNSVDLPVLVGMRMSLSFPVLISAIRLYTIDVKSLEQRDGIYMPRRSDLQENWFSDGGICSNFPIHFFDRWLPTHPTFGINLTALPKTAFDQAEPGQERSTTPAEQHAAAKVRPEYISRIAPEAPSLPMRPPDDDALLRSALLGEEAPTAGAAPSDQSDRVLLPDAGQRVDPLWKPVESLTRFMWSMFDTAMNYRDNTQLTLPSYKERAVHIRLDGTREGGLNLNMPEETVQMLQGYGRDAGILLRDQFNFDQHRWVRFRVLMGELEQQLLSLDVPLSTMARQGELTLYEQLAHIAHAAGFPFTEGVDAPWEAGSSARLRALRALIGAWREANRDETSSADLSQILLEITNIWRRASTGDEESRARTAQLLQVIERWKATDAGVPRYAGREVRFFKPVGGDGLELRVTPDL